MMRTAHTAMLGLAALALAGCGDPKRGEVLVHWTFAGQNCQQAGVHIIHVGVQGEVLTPNEFFCVDSQNNMRVGADIGAYFFGTYNLTVTGLDVDQTSIYQASQSFTVNANSIDVNIDLQRLPSTVATADLSWDALTSTGGFAPGANGSMTCSEAQVDTVRIFVDGVAIAPDVACDTNGVEGALISPLPAGNHTFSISGLRNGPGTPTLVYQTTTAGSAPFQIGATTNVDVTADSVGSGIGSATLSWGTGCSGTSFTYTLIDPGGQVTSGSSSCTQQVSLPNVMAGLWLVDATAGAHAHVLFGVPNQSSASWTINFGP